MKLIKVEEVESETSKSGISSKRETHVKIELLEPMSERKCYYEYSEKRGEGIHHIALAVTGIS